VGRSADASTRLAIVNSEAKTPRLGASGELLTCGRCRREKASSAFSPKGDGKWCDPCVSRELASSRRLNGRQPRGKHEVRIVRSFANGPGEGRRGTGRRR
jgi:hypothetical protein